SLERGTPRFSLGGFFPLWQNMAMARMGKLSRIVIPILSSLLMLLLLEGIARFYVTVARQPRGVRFDPEFGWRLLPNVRKTGWFWGQRRPAVTNGRGWRDAEHAYDKPPGVRRAVVVGDSVTFGILVDDGERFTDTLPAHFDRLEVI